MKLLKGKRLAAVWVCARFSRGSRRGCGVRARALPVRLAAPPGALCAHTGQHRLQPAEKAGRKVGPAGPLQPPEPAPAATEEQHRAPAWRERPAPRGAARAGLHAGPARRAPRASAPHPGRSGCWRNGVNRPVLKHGPRSLTTMRVFGWQARTRNESDARWDGGDARTIGRS